MCPPIELPPFLTQSSRKWRSHTALIKSGMTAMPLPQMDKADHSPSPDAASPVVGPSRSFLPYASAVGAAVILAVIAVSNFNGDSPDRLRPDIPKGISTRKTVYYNWRWFRCSVAVFELEPKFLADLRAGGIAFLDGVTERPWQTSPVSSDDNSKWQLEFANSLGCIGDNDLHTLFNKVSDAGGYYQVQSSNSVTLIAPDAGLVMVGGYE